MARAKQSSTQEQDKPILARVLVACAFGLPDQVVEVTAEDLAANPGVLDASPGAVEYAQSLRQ